MLYGKTNGHAENNLQGIKLETVLEPHISWPPKPSKYFSVGIFEYILASMLNVFLDV